MFIAIDDQCNIIKANEFQNDRRCLCPACKEVLIFKHGLIYQSHFSHKKNNLCQTFSEGETPEHIEGKLMLYSWFTKEGLSVELEAFLPSLNQRPDLLIRYKELTVAIEYQCSPISKDKVRSRTLGYKENGIQVFWILGSKLKVTKTVTTKNYPYITLGGDGTFILLQINQDASFVEILSGLKSSTRGIKYTKKRLTFPDFMNQLLRNQCRTNDTPFDAHENKANQETRLRKLSFHKAKKSRRFFELLYENRQAIDHLPDPLFYNVSSQWVIATFPYQWKYMMFLWVIEFKANQVITRKKIINKIRYWEVNEDVVFHCLPNIDTEIMYQVIFDYVDVLCKCRVLKKVGDDKWVCLKK